MLIVLLNKLDSLIVGCRVNVMFFFDWSYLILWFSFEEMFVLILFFKKKEKRIGIELGN